MCNNCITCNVYHFDNKSHYVLQLSRFILKTLLIYLNIYACITASLHHMQMSSIMFFTMKWNVIISVITISPFSYTIVGCYTDYFISFHIQLYRLYMIYPRQMNFAFTCNLADALMYKHILLNAVFSKLLQVVQFSYFICVNPLIYTIWTSMLYSCFACCF